MFIFFINNINSVEYNILKNLLYKENDSLYLYGMWLLVKNNLCFSLDGLKNLQLKLILVAFLYNNNLIFFKSNFFKKININKKPQINQYWLSYLYLLQNHFIYRTQLTLLTINSINANFKSTNT